MTKYLNLSLVLLTFLTFEINADLNLKCFIAVQKIPGYECLSDQPIGAGTSSIAYYIKRAEFVDEKQSDKDKAVSGEKPIVLKISETQAEKPENDPEIIYLTKVQGSEYVVKLFASSVENIDGDRYLYEQLEFAENGDLENFIKKTPQYFENEDNLFDFADKLVNGLQYIHSKKVVHASVKAQNVIVTKDMVPKYIDFNNSVDMDIEARSRGDHLFNAPEVVDRSKTIKWTDKQDIYSLGVLFYYLVHGDVPFNGITRYLHQRAVERGTYFIKEGINEDFVHIIQSCMRRAEKERSSLIELKEMIKKGKEKPANLRTKLQNDVKANIDNFERPEAGWLRMDPVVLLIIVGIVITAIALIAIIFSCSRKKQVVETNQIELYSENKI